MDAAAWVNGRLRFLDQTRLPLEERYVETGDEAVVAEAIRTLAVRGAPLIGIAAAYGVVLAVRNFPPGDSTEWRRRFDAALALFASTRPTAVNLFWALDRMRACEARMPGASPAAKAEALLGEALAIHREDADNCARIGENGAALLPGGCTVLTHCNTGALATGGIGTALGIIVTAWRQGKLRRVYVDETRPLLQGARLTAWELAKEGIPATLITDNMAAAVMKRERIDAVITGADRISARGDAANKVGTYGLAVLARHHGVPMYIAAPTTTIDMQTPDGASIVIEERSPGEVTHIGGVRVAAAGVDVYAPAFDVTPAELITAVVTEREVWRFGEGKPFMVPGRGQP